MAGTESSASLRIQSLLSGTGGLAGNGSAAGIQMQSGSLKLSEFFINKNKLLNHQINNFDFLSRHEEIIENHY